MIATLINIIHVKTIGTDTTTLELARLPYMNDVKSP
jgi:hypothetical protein